MKRWYVFVFVFSRFFFLFFLSTDNFALTEKCELKSLRSILYSYICTYFHYVGIK